jgi:OFA family oxalate/formate antiporter-like MFS transporter
MQNPGQGSVKMSKSSSYKFNPRQRNSKVARVVLWAATGVQFVSGVLYIWSIVSKELINRHGWTSTQASLPYTVATVVFAVSMFFSGIIQGKKSPRLMATIGSILLGVGLVLSGFARTPSTMVLTYSITIGIGIGFNNVAATPAAIKWYPPSKTGIVSGIVVAGIGLASVFYAPIINFLIEKYGLSKSFIIIGLGAFILAVGMSQFIINPPENYNDDMPKSNTEYTKIIREEMTWKQIIKTKNFYKLWTVLAFSSSAGLMIIGHISQIASLQANWEAGYLLVVLVALFNTLGRIVGGTVSDKIGRINMLRLAFIIQAVNMLFFKYFTSVITLAISVAMIGFCYGASFVAFPAATADFYGFKNLGTNYGLVFMAWGFGGVIGPLLAGKMYDATGYYNIAYIVACVLLTGATIITFSIDKHQVKRYKLYQHKTE